MFQGRGVLSCVFWCYSGVSIGVRLHCTTHHFVGRCLNLGLCRLASRIRSFLGSHRCTSGSLHGAGATEYSIRFCMHVCNYRFQQQTDAPHLHNISCDTCGLTSVTAG